MRHANLFQCLQIYGSIGSSLFTLLNKAMQKQTKKKNRTKFNNNKKIKSRNREREIYGAKDLRKLEMGNTKQKKIQTIE